MRRMMLIEASWPSNRLAAVTSGSYGRPAFLVCGLLAQVGHQSRSLRLKAPGRRPGL